MERLARLFAGTLILSVGTLLAGPRSSMAGQCRPVGNHRLGGNPHGVAFELRRTGGLFPPAIVSVYNDGHIAVSGGARLQDPNRHLPPAVLAGLLKLAEAEGFYGMPPNILCRTQETDVRTASISIHTRSGSRTVAAPTVCKAGSFNQLYAVLTAATGSSASP